MVSGWKRVDESMEKDKTEFKAKATRKSKRTGVKILKRNAEEGREKADTSL